MDESKKIYEDLKEIIVKLTGIRHHVDPVTKVSIDRALDHLEEGIKFHQIYRNRFGEKK